MHWRTSFYLNLHSPVLVQSQVLKHLDGPISNNLFLPLNMLVNHVVNRSPAIAKIHTHGSE